MTSNSNEEKITYRDLTSTFFKLGVFTFGGGFAMIPLIEQEIVVKKKWVEREDFVDLLTVAQSVPGPIALNSAAFIGYKSRGYVGALASVFGVALPSFVIILIVAIFFASVRDNEIVAAAFKAMRPVVVALIVAPTITLMKSMKWWSIAITLILIALFALEKLSITTMILCSIILGILWTYRVQITSKRGIKR